MPAGAVFCISREQRVIRSADLHRVGLRLLHHLQVHRRHAIEGAVAALHPGGEVHLADLAEQHRHALAIGHHEVAHVVQVDGLADVADGVLGSMHVGEAACRVGTECLERLLHLLEVMSIWRIITGSGVKR